MTRDHHSGSLVNCSLPFATNPKLPTNLTSQDALNKEIQSALTKLFSQNSVLERQTVLKMATQDQAQNQEQLLNQFKPEVQDQDQAQD